MAKEKTLLSKILGAVNEAHELLTAPETQRLFRNLTAKIEDEDNYDPDEDGDDDDDDDDDDGIVIEGKLDKEGED